MSQSVSALRAVILRPLGKNGWSGRKRNKISSALRYELKITSFNIPFLEPYSIVSILTKQGQEKGRAREDWIEDY